MVGASGAIAAIMGLFILRFYRTQVEIFYLLGMFRVGTFWAASVWVLLVWIGLEILSAVLDPNGSVAHWAHIGGFVAGALAAVFVGSVRAAKQEYFSDDPEANVEYVRRGEQVAAAQRALRADPNNAYLLRRLAEGCRQAGEYQQATAAYQRCV